VQAVVRTGRVGVIVGDASRREWTLTGCHSSWKTPFPFPRGVGMCRAAQPITSVADAPLVGQRPRAAAGSGTGKVGPLESRGTTFTHSLTRSLSLTRILLLLPPSLHPSVDQSFEPQSRPTNSNPGKDIFLFLTSHPRGFVSQQTISREKPNTQKLTRHRNPPTTQLLESEAVIIRLPTSISTTKQEYQTPNPGLGLTICKDGAPSARRQKCRQDELQPQRAYASPISP